MLSLILALCGPGIAATSPAAKAASPSTSTPPAVQVGTFVAALPGDCAPATVNGVSYSYCHGVYYLAGFQGNYVVYIVAQP